MIRIATLSGIILTTVIGAAMPAEAQVPASEEQLSGADNACITITPREQLALNAAKNEARQMAEAINDGLTVYRAEPAMHGSVTTAPCEMVSPDTWRFTFRGGDPMAVSVEEDYTILSVITVNNAIGSERSITVEYNGPIEDYTGIMPQPPSGEVVLVSEEATSASLETACTTSNPAERRAMNAAKHTARQVAERENGGLSIYRAEPAMHGSVLDAPCERTGLDTWRFAFRGGDPTAVALQEDYTVLSVVTVEGTGRESTFILEYNGPIEGYDEQLLMDVNDT